MSATARIAACRYAVPVQNFHCLIPCIAEPRCDWRSTTHGRLTDVFAFDHLVGRIRSNAAAQAWQQLYCGPGYAMERRQVRYQTHCPSGLRTRNLDLSFKWCLGLLYTCCTALRSMRREWRCPHAHCASTNRSEAPSYDLQEMRAWRGCLQLPGGPGPLAFERHPQGRLPAAEAGDLHLGLRRVDTAAVRPGRPAPGGRV